MFAFGATMLEMTSSRPLPQSGGVHSAEWHLLRVRESGRRPAGYYGYPSVHIFRAILLASASCKRSLASRTERVASEPLTASRRKCAEC